MRGLRLDRLAYRATAVLLVGAVCVTGACSEYTMAEAVRYYERVSGGTVWFSYIHHPWRDKEARISGLEDLPNPEAVLKAVQEHFWWREIVRVQGRKDVIVTTAFGNGDGSKFLDDGRVSGWSWRIVGAELPLLRIGDLEQMSPEDMDARMQLRGLFWDDATFDERNAQGEFTCSERPFKEFVKVSGKWAQVGGESGKWGYIDRKGKWVIEPIFDEVRHFDDSEGLACARVADKWGFVKNSGEWRIAPQFEDAATFNDGLARVKNDGRWGFIDSKGRWVIKPAFDEATDFSEGLAAARSGTQWGFIDRKGRWAIDPSFLRAGEFHEGRAAVQVDAGWGFISRNGTFVVPPQTDAQCDNFSGGRARMWSRDRWWWVDKDGRRILPEAGSSKEGEKDNH